MYQTSNYNNDNNIPKADIERLIENRKLRNRGRKNRAPLIQETRKISTTELVDYMGKTKIHSFIYLYTGNHQFKTYILKLNY